VFEEIENPIERMRALWDSVDRVDLSPARRLENARHILSILDGLPPVPEAAALVASHREKILPVLARLERDAARESELSAAADELFDAMGATLRDLRDMTRE
jgi:hypothetical protein